ncbi:MAG: dihydrofolate reductase family protein [Acidobacteria bacterium]|nr:dihydrofolate reductase family protein [Acidobacteriota bacterium]MCA1610527.1 dihydrofolate reductase family protein [Acidobacteriota bacterium]
MRKIIAYLATSADGYIARPDGDVAWLDRPRPPGDYGMPEFYRSVDTVLLGRRTWEMGVKLGQSSFKGKKNYVFSRSPKPAVAAGIEFVTEEVGTLARRLKSERGKDIWLVGGASLIGSFLDAGQVDDLILHVIPVLIGEGIPLVEPGRRELTLTLQSSQAYPDGVVRLHYALGGRRPPAASRLPPSD